MIKYLPSAQSEPDWNEIIVICDNCGHTVHAKRENCKVSTQPERKKGKWIDKGWSWDMSYQIDGRGNCWHEWECSGCEFVTKGAKWKYCPNCGCDMRSEVNK